MCSDLIRREDVLAVLCFSKETGQMVCRDLRKLLEQIKAIPSAEPERKWIPVTEKLPCTETDVLITVLDDSGDTPWKYTLRGWLTPDGKYWVADNEICHGVIAWMPLPEPWRGEV